MSRKYTIITAIIFLAIVSQMDGYAQNSTDKAHAYNVRMQLQGKISLDSLTRFVHHQTGIRFSFNSGKVKSNTEIIFPAGLYSFARLLQHIKKTTSLFYLIYKGYIVFQDKPRLAIKSKQTPKMQKVIAVKKSPPVQPVKIHKAIVPLLLPERDTGAGIHAIAVRLSSGLVKGWLSQKDSALLPASKPVIANAGNKRARTGRISSLLSLYSQAGFYISESLYSNLSYEIGMKGLHIVLSAGTDYRVFCWGAGVGSIFKNNTTVTWQLHASVGFTKRDILFYADSMNRHMVIKGKLYSFGFSWNKKLYSKWWLKIHPSFNLLQAIYYYNYLVTPVANLPGRQFNSEDKVKLLRVPLLLQNTFAVNASSSQKKWIGLSVGIYYNLF